MMKMQRTMEAILAMAAVVALGTTAQAAVVGYSIQSDGSISHKSVPGHYDDGDWISPWTSDRLVSSLGPALPVFNGKLVGGDTLEITFSAPTGSVFAVNPIAGGRTSFSLLLASSAGSTFPYVYPTGSFEWIGSTGTAPSISTEYTEFALGSQTFTIDNYGQEVTSPFSFAGFKCTVQVPDGFDQTYNNLTWFYATVGFQCSGGSDSSIVSLVQVPEPATMSVLALGGIATLIRRRRRA